MNKRLWFLFLALLVILVGCTNNKEVNNSSSSPNSSETNNTDESQQPYKGNDVSEPVELTWYIPVGQIPRDAEIVQEAVNEITKEEMNTTIKLMFVSAGDYPQKMNTIVASGEEVDIMWTSNWSFDYVQNVAKGAFAALDEDMIDQYAPDIFSQMPAYMKDGVKVGGKIYGIPNYQAEFKRAGFVVQKDYVAKYELDTSSIKEPRDMEPFYAEIKAAEPNVVGFGMGKSGVFENMMQLFGLESLLTDIAVIRLDDPGKVLNRYETSEYEEYLDMVRDWYTEGYINQDAAIAKNTSDMKMTGKVVSDFAPGLFPGGEAESANKYGGKEVEYVVMATPMVSTFNVQATINSISQSSQHKERALMFLNLVNTNSELFNLLSYGIEGDHYTLHEDETVTVNPDGGYALSSSWRFGNVFNGYELHGTKGSHESVMEINEMSEASPNLGFSFQGDSVTSQIANVTNTITQYQPTLETGSVDKSEQLAEFRSKLKQAGIDEIISEMQDQLDAFRNSQ